MIKIKDLAIQKGNAPRGKIGAWIVTLKGSEVAGFVRKPNLDSLRVIVKQLNDRSARLASGRWDWDDRDSQWRSEERNWGVESE